MEKRHESRGLGEMQKLADARPGSSDSVVVIVLMPPPVTAESRSSLGWRPSFAAPMWLPFRNKWNRPRRRPS